MPGQAASLLPIQFRFICLFEANCPRISGIVIPALAFSSSLRYEDNSSVGAIKGFIFELNLTSIQPPDTGIQNSGKTNPR